MISNWIDANLLRRSNAIPALGCALLTGLVPCGPALCLGHDAGVIFEKDRNVYVRIEQQDDLRFGPNDHPVRLNARDIGRAIAALAFAPDDASGTPQRGVKPVFTEEQIETLSQSLAAGLDAARADQDVVFSLDKKTRRPFSLSQSRLFVTGRVFFKDGRLNIIFGEHDRGVDEGAEAAYDPTHLGILSFNLDHGRRMRSSRSFKKTIATVPGVELGRLDDKLRADWAVLSLPGPRDAMAAGKQADGNDAPTETAPPLAGTVTTEMAPPPAATSTIDAAPPPPATAPIGVAPPPPATAPIEVAPSPPATAPIEAAPSPPAAATPSPPAAATPRAASPAGRSIEERLMILNRLRDRNLISNEEYESKRQKILDEL